MAGYFEILGVVTNLDEIQTKVITSPTDFAMHHFHWNKEFVRVGWRWNEEHGLCHSGWHEPTDDQWFRIEEWLIEHGHYTPLEKVRYKSQGRL